MFFNENDKNDVTIIIPNNIANHITIAVNNCNYIYILNCSALLWSIKFCNFHSAHTDIVCVVVVI